MNNEPSTPQTHRSEPAIDAKLDRLLDKYVSVWLWSILFGTSTGLLYTLTSYRSDSWRGFGLALAFPAFGALLCALQSWMQLLTGLRRFLLPRFILHRDMDKEAEEKFAYNLSRSFYYLVLASAMRIVLSLSELLLNSFTHF